MPHNEDEDLTKAEPIIITLDLKMNVPKPHSMVPVEIKPNGSQDLMMLTLISDKSPKPRIEPSKIQAIELEGVRSDPAKPLRFVPDTGLKIKIFFKHTP